jgi:ligand-binding sensor domain-containing protein
MNVNTIVNQAVKHRTIISSILITMALCFITNHTVHAGEYYTKIESNPIFEQFRWTSFDELEGNGVRCAVEGSDHSIWFGTANGLYHYDGNTWQHYFDEHEFLKSPIYALIYTKDNAIYVASIKGVCHMKNGAWYTDLKFPATNVIETDWEIMNFNITNNGDIWLGLAFGLLRIQGENITLYTTKAQIEGIETSFEGITIKYMEGVYSGINSFVVMDLLESKSDVLWLAITDGRLIRIDESNYNLETVSNYTLFTTNDGLLIDRNPILYETKAGHIINISQAIGGGINDYDPYTRKWISSSLSNQFLGDDLYFSICETEDGRLWIGGFGRAFALSNGVWEEYKQPELPIPPSRIIFVPFTDGSLWMIAHMATAIRIEYTTPQWQTYKDLLYQCETSNGDLWFLNLLGQVIIYHATANEWEQISDEVKMTDPVAIYVDSTDRVWIIGSHEGNAALAYLNYENWEIRSFPDLCWSFHPNGFLETRDKTIWFGAAANCFGEQKFGLIRYFPEKGDPTNDNAWQHYTGEEACEVAYSLGETEKGSILCGSYLGLFEFDGISKRALHEDLKHDLIKVESMVQDPVRGVWLGTRSQGLIHYINDDEWTQYTIKDGLVSNSISSVVIDNKGILWALTDKGVSSFDGVNWIKLALPDFFKVNRADGYLRIGRDNSIWVVKSLNAWFRRVYRDYEVDESPLISYRITPEQVPPECKIIKYDKKVYYPGNTTITWSGVDQWNATPVDKIQYSFRLDDDEWSPFTKETSHTFLEIKRGKHTIQVKSRDSFMNEDQTPDTINIKSVPPLWGQVWFLLLMAGFVGTIAYLFMSSVRKNNVMQEQHKLMTKKNDDLVKQQNEIEEKGRQIMELLENERERSWFNEGVIAIGIVIRQNRDDLKSLANNLLIKLIEYLQLQAGAFYIYIEGDEFLEQEGYLERVASYGINNELLKKEKIMAGEGIIGACFIEKNIMNITNVPDNYFIESGLGKAKVKNLILVPLKTHEDVIGIIEISSLKEIEEKGVKFLEAVAENIASNIQGLRAKEKIEQMLSLSKEQTTKLHEQEEEMRQQMEELQATQEESSRREQDLIANIAKLEKKLADVQSKNGK